MIIVTGVGRSGTRTVSRVLHESGVRMLGTEEGGWEDHEFRALNRKGIQASINARRWLSRATFLVVPETAEGSGSWGWKDPRAATLLWMWATAAELVGEPLHVVYCKRAAGPIEASWAVRYPDIDPMERWATIVSRTEAIERMLPNLSHTVIDFEDRPQGDVTDDEIRAALANDLNLPILEVT